jgi:tripartite-type tricarboxylate transporter receptor subunit TctC
MKYSRPIIARTFALVLFMASAGPASAADAFPAKPLRLVVPVLAGSGTDIISRPFAASLAQALGQSVVVDNKAGAGTTLGANFVAKSTPDGYTLLMATSSTFSILPAVQKTPYDPVKDLIPIAAFSNSPLIMVLSAEAPYKTLEELIAAAKAAPGKLTYGSTGAGTVTHMAMELFSVVARITLTHVPYKGTSGAYVDVAAGRIDVVVSSPASTLPLIKSGKLRALSIASPRRSPMLPAVPTVAELGLAGAESDFVTGMLAPAGTPKAVIARLQSEALKISRSAEYKEFLLQQGYEPLSLNSEEFSRLIRDDLAKWVNVVRERKIKLD